MTALLAKVLEGGYMVILSLVMMHFAEARSITVETRSREVAREFVSVSECKYIGLVGRAGGWYYVTAVAERVTRETYFVEVTSEGWMGDRSEKLLPDPGPRTSAIEITNKEFPGRNSESACQAYRAAINRTPGS